MAGLSERMLSRQIVKLAPVYAPHLEQDESIQTILTGLFRTRPWKARKVLVTERNVYVFSTGFRGHPKELLAKHPIGSVPIVWDLGAAVNLKGAVSAPLRIGDVELHVSAQGPARTHALKVIARAQGEDVDAPGFQDVGT